MKSKLSDIYWPIDALSEELRTVFMLREIEWLSTLETSEILRRHVEKQMGEEVQGLFTFAGTRCDRTVAQVFRRLGLPLGSERL